MTGLVVDMAVMSLYCQHCALCVRSGAVRRQEHGSFSAVVDNAQGRVQPEL